MKDTELNRIETAAEKTMLNEQITGFDAINPELNEFTEAAKYVPLPPTETGRKRHDAHELAGPKYSQMEEREVQSQYTEMYLG